MYDLLPGPPTPGTPLESLMLLVWRMRQDIEVQKTRAVVQAIIASAGEPGEQSNKQLQEAWESYLDEIYPFKRGRRVNADKAAIEYLKREAARGPLRVIPLQPLTRSPSRIRARAKKVQRE